jgi:beta-phosphoglucomutase-like phosphatase (HAD superfamily)
MKDFAVVYDMDGVIVDSETLFDRFFFEYLSGFGQTVDHTLIESVRALRSQEAWTVLKERFSLTESVPDLVRKAREGYIEFLQKLPSIEPVPGALESIEHLYVAKVPLALASSANPKRIDMFIDALHIRNKFRAFVSGDDVGKGKPAPDPYLRAAELIHYQPEQCVAIEDTAAGFLSAKFAGMKVIGYIGLRPHEDTSNADLVITDLKSIFVENLQALFKK